MRVVKSVVSLNNIFIEDDTAEFLNKAAQAVYESDSLPFDVVLVDFCDRGFPEEAELMIDLHIEDMSERATLAEIRDLVKEELEAFKDSLQLLQVNDYHIETTQFSYEHPPLVQIFFY